MIKTYYIGYHNRGFDNEFVILAETRSKDVALIIQNYYNALYTKSGISTRLEIITKDELLSCSAFRYSM